MRKNADPDRGKIAAASRANLRTLEANLSDDASYARELIREVRRAVDAGGDEAAIAAAYAIVIPLELIQYNLKSLSEPERALVSTDFIASLAAVGLKTREGGRKGAIAAHGPKPTREQIASDYVRRVTAAGGPDAAQLEVIKREVARCWKVSESTVRRAVPALARPRGGKKSALNLT